ncbi:MAG TPA: Trk family potassium uptake protein [Clostridiales bacterium]|nr:Trk family potassium uptake protein [Clostridiales bacterium]
MSPARVLALSFLLTIILGTALLLLPAASVQGQSMGFMDALFTATSAVCVTGLVVVDTGTQLSLLGQLVILFLVQTGGLGIMTMSTLVFMLLGKRITLRERLLIMEALNLHNLQGVVRLTRRILLITFLIEAAGAFLLALRFIPVFGWGTGIYFSIFHSISAFCNAGFDLMGHYSSLTGFTGDVIINFIILGLIVLGSLGFTVIMDLGRHGFHIRKWTLHTKIVVFATAALALSGSIFFFLVEYNNPDTMGHLSLGNKILASLFLSAGSKTAGMNTISIGVLTNASKFLMMLLMFIGGSPSSMGGGIKTTTFSVILLMVWSVIKGKEDIVVFKKCIPISIALRALAIALISLLALSVVISVLSLLESAPFMDIMFQAASALGTVGLSVMDIAGMLNISKMILVLSMFMGRVGPLSLTLAFAKKQSLSSNSIHYPEERIMVG